MQKVGNTTDTADANGEYTNGNVAQGIPPTIINAEMLNTFQREMVNVVEGSGIDLDSLDDGQLLKSIKRININQLPSSLASRGYQKLPTGLIMQWGAEQTGTSAGQPKTINYPIEFIDHVYSVTLTRTSSTISGTINSMVVAPIDKSTFEVRASEDDVSFYWFAVGK